MRSIIRRKIALARRMMDDAQNFLTHPRKAPLTCPAQPPANIPGAGGKMSHPEKESQNEKLKTLMEIAILEMNLLVDECIEIEESGGRIKDFVLTQHVLIDELEIQIEPEEPE